mmetsp:Transcript_28057/g.46441  ORF Transcript_28057/g.46441 Transcript_28057/m.46441 type:complete len:277 (+) Transcript_28057:201-1031(+)
MISIKFLALISLLNSAAWMTATEAFSVVPKNNSQNNINSLSKGSFSSPVSSRHQVQLQSTVLSTTPSTTSSSTTTTTTTKRKVSDQDQVIGTRPRIVSIESAEDYKAFLEGDGDDEEERLCIVKFYASWCKSCQKFGEQYKRIAREIGDLEEVTMSGSSDDEVASVVREGEIRMGEIEYGSNTELCKSLGVTKLPTVHIYSSKGKLVDSFRCGPKKVSVLLDKLDMYMSMSPAEVDFEADMYEGALVGDSILDALNEEISAAAAVSDAASLLGASS